MSINVRTTQRQIELRQRSDGGKTLSGYAAVYYNPADSRTEYKMWSDMVERIAPGAFDRAISENQDVRALFNHESECLLGRVSSKTCRLSVDSVGLRYEIDLPDTQTGRDVAELVGRGDLSGSSFSFIAQRTQWEDTPDGVSIRTLMDVDLQDVGPVTFPAYEATTAAMRSSERSGIDEERRAHLQQTESETEAVRVATAIYGIDG